MTLELKQSLAMTKKGKTVARYDGGGNAITRDDGKEKAAARDGV